MKYKSIYTAVIISIAGAFFVPTVALSSCGMNYPDAWESGSRDGRFDAENNKGNAPGNHRPDAYERAQNGDRVAKCYRAGYKNGFENAYADLKRHSKKKHSSHKRGNDSAPRNGTNERAYYDDGCAAGTSDAKDSMSQYYGRHSDSYDSRFKPYFKQGYEHCWSMYR